MLKRSAAIAMAVVGLIVGAGFASGQEMMQYFVAFGRMGIWGAVMAGIIMAASAAAVLSLASYFLADEHTAVFDRISSPIMSRVLDIAVMITLFSTGFTSIAFHASCNPPSATVTGTDPPAGTGTNRGVTINVTCQ